MGRHRQVSLFLSLAVLSLALVLSPRAAAGAPPPSALQEVKRSERHRLVRQAEKAAERRVLFRQGDLVATTPGEREVETLAAILSERRGGTEGGGPLDAGGGAGALITTIALFQDNFVDPNCNPPATTICPAPCNNVTIFWENGATPNGVRVVINNIEQGTVPPPFNAIGIGGFPPADWTIRVESLDDGSFAEAMITVFDMQPMGDPVNFLCAEGLIDGEGTCELIATLETPAVPPSFYAAFLDGAFLGLAAGDATEVFVRGGNAPGEYCVAFQSVLEAPGTDNVFYEGCPVESCCTLTCVGEDCNPPIDLLLCQVVYGPGAEDSAVDARWQNGDTYDGTDGVPAGGAGDADGINGYRDGELLGSLPGAAEGALFGLLSPGEHTFGVEGVCAAGSTSTRTEDMITVLTTSPHTDPVLADPICEFAAPDSLTATWSLNEAAPSVFIDVYAFDGVGLFFLGSLFGDTTEVTVTGAMPTDLIVLQFFEAQDGSCYGSPFIPCVTITRPENDICDSVIALTLPAAAAGTTMSATDDAVPDCLAGGAGGPAPLLGVWYTFEGPGGPVRVSTCAPGTDHDTQVHVYAGGCDDLAVCAGANDDDPACLAAAAAAGGGAGAPTGASTAVIDTVAGTQYFVLVAGANGEEGSFELTIESVGTGPFIRGDCNGDGVSVGNPTDAIFILSYLFLGGVRPPCLAACDMNGDGGVPGNPTDALYFLNFSFLGGQPIPPPAGACAFSSLEADRLLTCADTEGCSE
jgi:hypothetical protein